MLRNAVGDSNPGLPQSREFRYPRVAPLNPSLPEGVQVLAGAAAASSQVRVVVVVQVDVVGGVGGVGGVGALGHVGLVVETTQKAQSFSLVFVSPFLCCWISI